MLYEALCAIQASYLSRILAIPVNFAMSILTMDAYKSNVVLESKIHNP